MTLYLITWRIDLSGFTCHVQERVLEIKGVLFLLLVLLIDCVYRLMQSTGSMLLRWSVRNCRVVWSELSLVPRIFDRQHSHTPRQHHHQPSRYYGSVEDVYSSENLYSSGLTPLLRHPLRGEEARQFLTSDEETIVCVHPTIPVDILDTKVQ